MLWYLLPAAIGWIIGFLMIPVVLLRKLSPPSTFAWIMAIIFLPYIGTFWFLIFGRRRSRRKMRARLRERYIIFKDIEKFLKPGDKSPIKYEEEDDRLSSLINLSINVSGIYPADKNRVDLYISADRAYEKMLEDIEQAQDHINMLYYIFQPDHIGQRFMDVLVQKAREGVRVNFMYDFVGSWNLRKKHVKILTDAGVHCAPFNPGHHFAKIWSLNFRNHRKITIIDGRIGYTGGINIGDEYTGRLEKFGPWRDSQTRIEGPAVDQLQRVFVDDWHFATGETLAEGRYFPKKQPAGDHVVHVISSGPEDDISPIHHIIFTAIMSAKERLFITSAYFIPDEAMLTALQSAALSGVDVRLIVPSRSDSVFVQMAMKTYYEDLLAAGVRIFEYKKGILHAKCVTVDGLWGTVGSANMDIRSFWLNYEVNAFIYGHDFAGELEKVFEADLESSDEVLLERLQNRAITKHLTESFCRLFSPYL